MKQEIQKKRLLRNLNTGADQCVNQALTLKADPSVSLHLPPDGLARMFLQLLHAMTDWAWLKTTEVSLHPPHLTSMK